MVLMAMPWYDWFNPVDSIRAIIGAGTDVGNAINNFVTSTAGDIASGLEGGVVALLGDVWATISGVVLTGIGLGIIILVLLWAFKREIIDTAALAGLVTAAVK
jgi:hypothetical protein